MASSYSCLLYLHKISSSKVDQYCFQDFMKELRRVYLEGTDEGGHNLDQRLVNAAPDSLDDLISEMSSPSFYQHLDLRTFLLKTKAMVRLPFMNPLAEL